jgi:hypothetical protein
MRKKDSSKGSFAFQMDRKQKSYIDFNKSTEEKIELDKKSATQNFRGLKLVKNKSMAAVSSDDNLNNQKQKSPLKN